jgi:two-component system, sensor histidine kinase SagS
LAERARILVFTGSTGSLESLPTPLRQDCDIVSVRTIPEGLARLQAEHFDGVFAPTRDPESARRLSATLQTGAVLEVVAEAVAVLGLDLRIRWANAAFERWTGPATGRVFHEALGSPAVLGPDMKPFESALAGKSARTRLQMTDARILELRLTPVFNAVGAVQEIVALAQDVTLQANQQQILDSLHQAANQLAALDPTQLAEMDVDERIELLKYNIRKLTHDLLHYDVIEIRLLDPETGRLDLLLTEGMLPEAANRVLYSSVDGNGVTGYVAATGKSYICNDASCDPRYLEGSQGARSSLTVAIKRANRVIGTFNVESPKPGAFGEKDLQFTEIFCREVAAALFTLELLAVEKRAAASQSIEAVSREVALPVDDILAAATSVLDRWIGHEPEMEEKLKIILDRARTIKESIQKVGEDLIPATKGSLSVSQENPARLRGKRILVVDNDERIRRTAHSLLGRLGAVVETARDGREAVTMAKLSPYDAMLADIRLPDMSGYDVFRHLRGAQPNARVVLMTAFGYDPSHAIVKARQEGLTHVLYKPFRVEQMLGALDGATPASNPGIAPASPRTGS